MGPQTGPLLSAGSFLFARGPARIKTIPPGSGSLRARRAQPLFILMSAQPTAGVQNKKQKKKRRTEFELRLALLHGYRYSTVAGRPPGSFQKGRGRSGLACGGGEVAKAATVPLGLSGGFLP